MRQLFYKIVYNMISSKGLKLLKYIKTKGSFMTNPILFQKKIKKLKEKYIKYSIMSNIQIPGRSLSYPQLQHKLHKWCMYNLTPKALSKKISFKICQKELDFMITHFSTNIVLYLMLKLFPWVYGGNVGQKCAQISEEIKEEYRRWLMQKFKSSNIMFELFVVFHVKVTCTVTREIFEGVDVDQQMEKQWCIILYYSILGVKVHEKMYDILVRRFVNVQPQKSKKQDIVSTNQSIAKKQKKSVFSIQTKTRKNIDISPPLKRLRTIKNIRYSNSSCCQKENEVKKSELEYFQTELRQNLNVKPLPKIKRKRMKFQEFQRIMTEPSTTESNFFSQKDDKDKDQSEHEYKFKSMFTNQLSTALKINHPEKLEFELNSKKVRLNQTMQNFSRENRMAVFENKSQKENFSLFALGTVSQHISQGKLHVDEWSTLVGNLKRKVFILNSKNEVNKGHLPEQSPLAIQKHYKKKDRSFDSLKASKQMTPI